MPKDRVLIALLFAFIFLLSLLLPDALKAVFVLLKWWYLSKEFSVAFPTPGFAEGDFLFWALPKGLLGNIYFYFF